MDFRNLTISDFKRNHFNRCVKPFIITEIICFIVTIALIVLMAEGVFGDSLDVEFFVAMLVVELFGLCSIIFLVLVIVFSIRGKRGANAVSEFIRNMGEENFLNEVHNETLHIFSKGRDIYTVFTTKHIIDLTSGVYPASDISYVYSIQHRGRGAHAYMVALYYDGRQCTFGRVGRYSKRETAGIYNALITVNNNLLVGKTRENEIEHARRVQMYRRQL